MKTSLPLTIARRVGVGLAICVPALVVAQTLPSFGPNQVLRSDQLQTLVTVLNETRSRVDTLQANAGTPFNKSRVYQTPAAVSALFAPGTEATVLAECEGVEDILLNCSCGTPSGSRQVDMRVITVTSNNNSNAASRCTCAGDNSGSNDNQISAIATCFDLPPFR